MATPKPLTDFDPLLVADVQSDDILFVVDIHDTAQSSAGSTKTLTLAALWGALTSLALTTLSVTGLSTLGSLVVTGLSTFTKLKGGGSTPAFVAIGASSSLVGTDTAGMVTITTIGSNVAAIGCVITFATPYAATPYVVACLAGSNFPASAPVVQCIATTTNVSINFTCASTDFLASTLYKFSYHVIA